MQRAVIVSIVAAAILGAPSGLALAETRNLAETAEYKGTFGKLLQAAEAAGIKSKLTGDGPYTLFAPSDAAFSTLDETLLEELMKPENKEELAELLQAHIVPGKVLAVDLKNSWPGKILKDARGGELSVANTDAIMVGDARIVQYDIAASNGVIHVIDAVIEPAN